MNIVLIGYRGSGKTSIGRKLADQLWRSFVDLDERIVRDAGKPIRRIFEEDGEGRFRDLESAALAEVLKLDDHVIALGGGAVVRPENQALLRASQARVVYLHCEPETLARRIAADAATADNRPSLTPLGGGVEEIRQVLGQRLGIYRQTASVELDVTNLSIEEAVIRVVRLV